MVFLLITNNKKCQSKRILLFVLALIHNKFKAKFRDGTNLTMLNILGNQHEFSKTTQDYHIIYARSPVQLEQYFRNQEIEMNIKICVEK